MRTLTWTSVSLVLALGCNYERAAAEPKPVSTVESSKPVTAAPASATSSVAELGKLAPDFTLTDTEGKQVKLSSFKGKIVVLEWFNPDCPFVKHAHGKGP